LNAICSSEIEGKRSKIKERKATKRKEKKRKERKTDRSSLLDKKNVK
jgi:hypothetical protein